MWIAAHGARERLPILNSLANIADGAGQLGALSLVPERAEAGNEGNAGADHRGKLPGEDDQVVVADSARQEAERLLARLLHLGYRNGEVAHFGDSEFDQAFILGRQSPAHQRS